MDNKLLILKIGLNFWHRRNQNPLSDRNISDFNVSVDDNFVLVELDGSQSWVYKVENVSIWVDTLGTIETFTNRLNLIARLQQLGYTPYLVINGLTLNELNAIRNSNNPSASNPYATMQDVGSGGGTIVTNDFGKFTLVRHASGNTGATIQLNDLAHGQIDNETYCLLGRYKNLTNDNNTNNSLNYELLTTSGLISI